MSTNMYLCQLPCFCYKYKLLRLFFCEIAVVNIFHDIIIVLITNKSLLKHGGSGV